MHGYRKGCFSLAAGMTKSRISIDIRGGFEVKKTFFTIILIFITSTTGLARQLTGTVKSVFGKPLSGVKIYSRSENQLGPIGDFLATSDEHGYFNLLTPGKVVFLQLASFRPMAIVVSENQEHIDVVMESAEGTGWLLPTCPNGFDTESLVGIGKLGIRLPVPPMALTEKSQGGHDFSHVIYYKKRSTPEALVYYWSWMAVGFPSEELILTSSEFSIRSFGNGKYDGIDIRGISKDGTYGRFLGSGGMEVSYRNVSKEAAAYFDKIIGGLCIK